MGFKKIKPIVICNYTFSAQKSKMYRHGLYIKDLSQLKKEEDIRQLYPKVNQLKNHSYILKISNEVSLYLIIVGNEFTFVIHDETIQDFEDFGAIYSNKITTPISSEKLDDKFWKKCLEKLNKGIQRELLLKEIFKYG